MPWPAITARVVERRDQGHALVCGELARRPPPRRRSRRRQADLGAVAAHRLDLGQRRVRGHHHQGARRRGCGRRPRPPGRGCRRWRRPARASSSAVAQGGDLVERAAGLERARALQVLGLQPHRRADPVARSRARPAPGVSRTWPRIVRAAASISATPTPRARLGRHGARLETTRRVRAGRPQVVRPGASSGGTRSAGAATSRGGSRGTRARRSAARRRPGSRGPRRARRTGSSRRGPRPGR